MNKSVNIDAFKVFMCNGYPCIYYPTHHRAEKAGWVYLHIIKAEELLGRLLKDKEVVHHKDGDRTNYNIDNLMVFKTDNDHKSYHNENEAVLQFDGSYFCPDKSVNNYNRCKCGQLKYYTSAICIDCLNKQRNADANIKVDRVTLKRLIREKSFLEIGRILKCSDNYVRKLCRKYNLPDSKLDIKAISDNDWLNI